jgi:ribonuclease HI
MGIVTTLNRELLLGGLRQVKNQDLWKRLIKWSWIRGHNGNEKADALAREAAENKCY